MSKGKMIADMHALGFIQESQRGILRYTMSILKLLVLTFTTSSVAILSLYL